jgi:hypothetical protein
MRQVSFRPVKGSGGICLMYPLDTTSDKDVGALRWSSVNCPISPRSTDSSSRRDASFRNCCLWEQAVLPHNVVKSRRTANARCMSLTLNGRNGVVEYSCLLPDSLL